MSNSICRTLRLWETRYFMIGVAVGLMVFIGQLGLRPIVLLSGIAIVLAALIYWFWQTRSTAKANSTNLLELDVFVACLDGLKAGIPVLQLEAWKAVQDKTLTIWAIAAQLAKQESLLLPDLLETLHSTLELAERSAEALCLSEQMQTPSFQDKARRQMPRSFERLQITQTQLQTLADQLAWERLEARSTDSTSVLSSGLRGLIIENEKTINQ
jgi:hypothetical protein